MTSGDPLFDLIHSMTTHEKIFFKRYAALSGKKKPHYVRLFDVMDSFKKYDEAKLKRKLQKEVFANRLAFERSYLKNALLESLSAGQMGKKQGSKPQALSSQLRVDLGYVFILTEKGSYDLAIKLNENILKQAEEGELFHIWGAALQQKYSLMFLSQRGEKGFEKRLTQVMDAQIELAKKSVRFPGVQKTFI